MVLGGLFTKNGTKMVRRIDGDPLFSASKIDILSVGVLFRGPLLALAQFLCTSLLFGVQLFRFPTTLGSISDYFQYFAHMLWSKIMFFNMCPPFVHHFNIFLKILCNLLRNTIVLRPFPRNICTITLTPLTKDLLLCSRTYSTCPGTEPCRR